MDTFGPIADNAGGIIKMSNTPEEFRKKTAGWTRLATPLRL
jgi:Na+/H+-translocating membrane pyrophosphatase